MKIEKEFEVAQPPEIVWDAFSDMRLVASCVPGASIVEDLGDGRYVGRFAVKVGPLAAAFEGRMTLTRDDAARVGVVEGKGADARSNSRVSGSMSYRLFAAGSGDAGSEGAAGDGGVGSGGVSTRIAVDCTMVLAGALAQFGKAAVVREIVNRITAEFARNLEARLDARRASDEAAQPASGQPASEPVASATPGSGDPKSPVEAPSLDAGKLLGSIVIDWLKRLWRSLTGARRGVR